MQTGMVLAQRYRLEEKLGEGGMGVVFRAHDTLLNRPVAVKSLTPALLGSDGLARLLREAQAAAQLTHTNIVAVYDVIDDGDARLIIMEYVEGRTLAQLIPQEVPGAVDLLTQICRALQYAHSRGIIHRDIKPENIVVTPDGVAKVMDFGLARSEGRTQLTQTGLIVGTVAYMAPEQILGGTVDARTDLYSLGCVAYELLTRRKPFEGDDAFTILSQHVNVVPVAPRWHTPSIPPTLDSVVMRLLAKDPDERYPSADDMIKALELVGEPSAEAEAQPIEAASRTILIERIVRGKLVGRSEEIRELREHLNRMLSGEGRLVMISGEPGIGKTRLAEELAVYAHLRGAWVLRGHCYEQDVGVPYLPFVETLRDLAHRAEATLAELGDRVDDLARLLPALRRQQIEPPMLPPEEERVRVFDAVTEWIAATARHHLLVFLLDDLHWADRASLRLLQHLSRHLRDARVLLIGTYREMDLDAEHPLNDTLAELNRERLFYRLPLRRLSERDTQLMLAVLFDTGTAGELAAPIYRETEGNPFFIEEVMKALVEEGRVYREDGQWRHQRIEGLEIPQSVKAAIGRRLHKASDARRKVLTIAAVIGREFDPDVLVKVSQLDEDTVLDALDEATRLQLTRETKAGYTFEHALIRQTLYGGLNTRRRARLHQQVGEALEALSGTRKDEHIEELAYHFGEAGLATAVKGIEYNLQAARKAADLYAMEEAEHRLKVALELAESIGNLRLRAKVLEGFGDLYLLFGDNRRATEAFHRAIELLKSAGDADSAQLLLVYCRVAEASATWWTERSDEAAQYAQTVVDLLEESPEIPLKARALSLLSIHKTRAGDLASARAYAQQAIDVATRLNDQHELARGYRALAMLHRYGNEWEQMRELFHRRRTLLDPMRTAQDSDLYVDLVQSYLMGGDYSEATQAAQEYLQLAEKLRSPTNIYRACAYLSNALFLSNRWDEALHFADRAVDLSANLRGVEAFTGSAQALIGILFAARDEERARQRIARMKAVPHEIKFEHIGPHLSALAITLILPDQDEVARLLPIVERERPRCLTCTFMYNLWVGEARVMRGDLEGALANIEAAQQAAPQRLIYFGPGGIAYLRGLVAEAGGKLDEAAPFLEATLTAMSVRPMDFYQALYREVAARVFLTRRKPGDLERGRQLLVEARNFYRMVAAGRFEARAGALLAAHT